MSEETKGWIQKVLEALGLEVRREGLKWTGLCPNPGHTEGKASVWAIVDDGSERTGVHHCFVCRFGGGLVELVATVRRMTPEDARAWLKRLETPS